MVNGVAVAVSFASLLANAAALENISQRSAPSADQKTRLYAGIHPELDRDDLKHLHSNKSASLFYTQQHGQTGKYITNEFPACKRPRREGKAWLIRIFSE